LQETPKVLIASSPTTLSDVRFDGHNTAPNLTRKPKLLFGGKSSRSLIDFDAQTMSSLPNIKSPEIFHDPDP
jgi:hypothetical protein